MEIGSRYRPSSSKPVIVATIISARDITDNTRAARIRGVLAGTESTGDTVSSGGAGSAGILRITVPPISQRPIGVAGPTSL